MSCPKSIRWAWDVIGGLSEPSKMPCYGFGLPAKKCITGKKLRDVAGSTCNKCYAMKGFYMYPKTQSALERRYNSIYHPEWVHAFVTLVGAMEGSGYFRFHDSGDIDSVLHFSNICEIARKLSGIKFWLPTREYSIVAEYVANGGKIPSNLIVRLSAYMVDQKAPVRVAKGLGVQTSTVVSDGSHNCPASNQNNMCLTCRKCWDASIPNVSYKRH